MLFGCLGQNLPTFKSLSCGSYTCVCVWVCKRFWLTTLPSEQWYDPSSTAVVFFYRPHSTNHQSQNNQRCHNFYDNVNDIGCTIGRIHRSCFCVYSVGAVRNDGGGHNQRVGLGVCEKVAHRYGYAKLAAFDRFCRDNDSLVHVAVVLFSRPPHVVEKPAWSDDKEVQVVLQLLAGQSECGFVDPAYIVLLGVPASRWRRHQSCKRFRGSLRWQPRWRRVWASCSRWEASPLRGGLTRSLDYCRV